MDDVVAQTLLAVNGAFYEAVASDFARTRARPQPGFERLLSWMPPAPFALLDVGCGEGRLGRFFFRRELLKAYHGVDGSEALLERAREGLENRPVHFYQRHLAQSDALANLPTCDVVACLATLQHIPQVRRRENLLRQMAERLEERGTIVLSTWQFMASARQRRKIQPWSEIGLDDVDVDPGDYLLTWKGGRPLRYVRYIDLAEVRALADAAGLDVVDTFRADGREGDLNLYAALRPG